MVREKQRKGKSHKFFPLHPLFSTYSILYVPPKGNQIQSESHSPRKIQGIVPLQTGNSDSMKWIIR